MLIIISVNLYSSDEHEIAELKSQVKTILKRIEALEKRAEFESENRVNKVIVKSVLIKKIEELKFKIV